MKRTITLFISVTLFFLYFISCKSKDVQPNSSTVLKSISTDLVSLKGNSKSKIVFTYTGSDIIKMTSVDSSFSGQTVDVSTSTFNYTYTNKILTKLTSDSKSKTFSSQTETNIIKTGNIYDITSKLGTAQIITQIEVNADDQIIKYKELKTIIQDLKGVPIVTAGKTIMRYEYNTKGNLIKVYTNQNAPKEYLFVEMVYDANPNVYGALKWALSGRIGNTLPLGESKNNPTTIKSYTSSGVLNDSYTNTYVYDKNTAYPVLATWINKGSNGQPFSTYKYTFVY